MIEAVLIAWGLVGGADWRWLVLLGSTVWFPLPTGVAVVAAALVGRREWSRRAAGDEVRFAEAVAGELRAGASLRAALRVACADRDDAGRIIRRLEVGDPLPEAIDGIRQLLPTIGTLVESAVLAGGGGGRMLPIFEELVVHATAEEAARAELRTAVAQVKASMMVMVGAPVAYLAWSTATGRMTRLLALPGGLPLALIGGGLFVLGVVVMLVMARRR